MSRLSPPSRDQVPEDQRGLFDELTKKHGLSQYATASILVRVPRIWAIDRELGDYLIRDSALSQDVIHLIFLVVSQELDCQFMWDWHAEPAIKAGFSSELLEALLNDTDLPELSDKHLAVIYYGREIYRNHFVSYGTFSMAKEQFGEAGVVDLGMLYGRLHMHSLLLNGTDANIRSEGKKPVPPVY